MIENPWSIGYGGGWLSEDLQNRLLDDSRAMCCLGDRPVTGLAQPLVGCSSQGSVDIGRLSALAVWYPRDDDSSLWICIGILGLLAVPLDALFSI